MDQISPIHPGEVLLEDYLKPLGISQTRLAIAMRVPSNRIFEIVQGKRAITADTALRLELVTGSSARFWLNLQAEYDLRVARAQMGDQLQQEIAPIPPRNNE